MIQYKTLHKILQYDMLRSSLVVVNTEFKSYE